MSNVEIPINRRRKKTNAGVFYFCVWYRVDCVNVKIKECQVESKLLAQGHVVSQLFLKVSTALRTPKDIFPSHVYH